MISTQCSHELSRQIGTSFYLAKAAHFATLLKQTIKQWRHNYYSRKALLQLDQRALSDIGLNRSDAIEEARKPFWKI